jgi:hypothetical protein
VSRCRAPPLIDFTSLFLRIYESVYSREQSQLLADFAVGLVTTIPVSSVDVSTVRFGITRPYEVREGPGMTMGYVDGPPYVPARVFFENKSGTRSASLPFKLRLSNIPGLADDLWKARFASPLMDYFVLGRKEQKPRAIFNWPARDGVPLAELDAWARILRLFTNAENDGVRVTYEWGGTRKLGAAFHTAPVEFPDHAMELAAAVEDGAYVVAHFRLPPDIAVSPGEIRQQAKTFHQMRYLFDRTSGPFVMDAEVPAGDDGRSLVGQPVAMALPVSVYLGDRVFSAGFLYHGIATLDATTGKLGLRDGKLALLREWVTPLAQDDSDEIPDRVIKLAHQFPGADKFVTIILPADG